MKNKIGLAVLSLLAGISTTTNANDLLKQTISPANVTAKNSCVISPVQTTSEIEFYNVNLCSNDRAPLNPVFLSYDPSSYNLSSSVTIYDTLGVPHQLSIFYIRSSDASLTWSTLIEIDGNMIAKGQLIFDWSGALVNQVGMSSIVWSPNNLAPQVLNIVMNCSTQNAASDNQGVGWQDGYSSTPNFHALVTKKKTFLKNTCAQLPRATSVVKLNTNLSATDLIPSHSGILPNDPSSYNFKDNLTIYDSLGAPYNLSIYFAKDEHNGKWNVSAYLYETYLGSGQIQFNSQGVITESTGLDKLNWSPYSGAASPQSFKIDMTCSTQYGLPDHDMETPWQNGWAGNRLFSQQ